MPNHPASSKMDLPAELAVFGLPADPKKRDAAISAHLATLPFPDPEELRALVAFLHDELPALVVCHSGVAGYREVAMACIRLGALAWQCGSLFPEDAESYAAAFIPFLRNPADCPHPAGLKALAALLTADGAARCGFQPWNPENPGLIRDSERALNTGAVDGFLKASSKYAEFCERLESAAFAADWAALKSLYPEFTDTAGRVLHRTLMPERKWLQGRRAAFDTAEARFRAHFDALCWKYCLWGVLDDRPLLLKPSVNITPYGTQIFIPAYMSLDPRRDLDLHHIAALHRARGVPRQGAALTATRADARARDSQVARADAEARKLKLRGASRYDFIRKKAGLHPDTEDAHIRRMVKAGKTTL